jgi:hypothetical protein
MPRVKGTAIGFWIITFMPAGRGTTEDQPKEVQT